MLVNHFIKLKLSGGTRVLYQEGAKKFSRAPNYFPTALTIIRIKLNVTFKFTIVAFKLTNLFDIGTCNNYYNKNMDVYFII